MIRLFVTADLHAGASVELDEGQSRYVATVMRQRAGDAVALFNGRDGEWRAVVSAVGKRGVTLETSERLRSQESGPDLDLLIALVKRARLEIIVEKAAELGVRRIRPVVTTWTNADHTRVDRLQAIAVEASEQTGRLDTPTVEAPVKLSVLMSAWPSERRLLFCDESRDAPPALEVLREAGGGGPWAVLIGPEGGFSPAERDELRAAPYASAVSLGPRILRADTAAISALTLWQATQGDWTRG